MSTQHAAPAAPASPARPAGTDLAARSAEAVPAARATGADPAADRAAVTALVSRYFRSLDERRIDADWGRAFLTEDVRSATPVGDTVGRDDTVRHTREALLRFAATQHMSSDVLVTLDGDRAEAEWNALMTHVHTGATLAARGPDAPPLFTVGGRFAARLVRTGEGWRFSGLTVTPVWRTGEPPFLD